MASHITYAASGVAAGCCFPVDVLIKSAPASMAIMAARWINSGLATVGFRLPDHPVTRELIQAEGPLIGPSANKSGKASGRYFDQIRDQFDFQVTGYQDDDALLGVDSTILDLSGNKVKILRQGSITQEDILTKLPKIPFEEV